jgi:hypothetical protein
MIFSALRSWNAAKAKMPLIAMMQKRIIDAPIFIETCMRIVFPLYLKP